VRVQGRFGVREIVAEEEEGDHDDEGVAGEAGTKVEVGRGPAIGVLRTFIVSAVGVMMVIENRANGKHEQQRSTDRDNPVYQVVPAISWLRHAMPTRASDGSSRNGVRAS
jgi:hypothetical protein